MNIQGKLIEIYPVQNVSDRFRKREFVIEYADNPQYPQFIKFEFTQDACEELDKYQTGQDVNVEFNLRGRKWVNPQGQAVYFNTLQAWRLAPATAGAPAPEAPSAVPPAPTMPPMVGNDSSSDDDLPF
ncbi:DUF3127 domain-containing protein [Persicobacter psychrovividus]|uniref:DUF3127 domain-containing protein n=1 Tax=Persicobacter psychrovividus TaxID=387638 RepID=A0ABM7VES8_9BACT|nr:hypothetical protein PEPS_16420 [Persicobacter psychrovividus]